MATLPSNVALTNIADGANIVASDHRNNYSAIQTAVNALLTILGGGAAGQLLGSSGGTTVSWGAGIPSGAISQYAGAAAPSGWLLCDGSPVSRTTYASLFAAISTAYGTGDGSTTFNLPDLQGRVPVGKGTHADVNTLGNSDGLAAANRRPKHKHTVNDPGHVHSGGVTATNLINYSSPSSVPQTVGNTGSATTGITVGPQTGAEPTDSGAYLVVNHIIKT